MSRMTKDAHHEKDANAHPPLPPLPPVWLKDAGCSGADLAAWIAVLQASSALQARVESDMHRGAGVTPFEAHFLAVLKEAGGEPLAMSRAAHLVDSSLSRLSHVVRRLEARGWVERLPSPEDARVTLVRLMDEGRRRIDAAAGPHQALMEDVFVTALDAADRQEAARLSLKLLGVLRPGHWLFTEPTGPDEGADADAASHVGEPLTSS